MNNRKMLFLLICVSMFSFVSFAQEKSAAKSWIIEAGEQTFTIDWVRNQQRPFSVEIASDLEIDETKNEKQTFFRRTYKIEFYEPWELWLTGSDSRIGNFSFTASIGANGTTSMQTVASENRTEWREVKSSKTVIKYLSQKPIIVDVSTQGEVVVKLVDAQKNVERSYSIKFAPRQFDIILNRATGPVPVGIVETQVIKGKPSFGEKIIIFDTNEKKK